MGINVHMWMINKYLWEKPGENTPLVSVKLWWNHISRSIHSHTEKHLNLILFKFSIFYYLNTLLKKLPCRRTYFYSSPNSCEQFAELVNYIHIHLKHLNTSFKEDSIITLQATVTELQMWKSTFDTANKTANLFQKQQNVKVYFHFVSYMYNALMIVCHLSMLLLQMYWTLINKTLTWILI